MQAALTSKSQSQYSETNMELVRAVAAAAGVVCGTAHNAYTSTGRPTDDAERLVLGVEQIDQVFDATRHVHRRAAHRDMTDRHRQTNT